MSTPVEPPGSDDRTVGTMTRVIIPLDVSTTEDESSESTSLLGSSSSSSTWEGPPMTCLEKFACALYIICNLVLPLVVMIGVPVAMLIIGGMYWDECPIERLIPFMLIMGGSIAFVYWPLETANKRGLRDMLPGGEYVSDSSVPITAGKVALLVFLYILRLLLFCWSITAAVLIFRLDGKVSEDRESRNYCRPVLIQWAACSVLIISFNLLVGAIYMIIRWCRRDQGGWD